MTHAESYTGISIKDESRRTLKRQEGQLFRSAESSIASREFVMEVTRSRSSSDLRQWCKIPLNKLFLESQVLVDKNTKSSEFGIWKSTALEEEKTALAAEEKTERPAVTKLYM